MTTTHKAELAQAGTEIIFEDPEALRSARLFKFISDNIWELRPKQYQLAMFSVESVVPPDEAIELANNVATEIDGKLVLADGSKDLELKGLRDERKTIPAKRLAVPQGASVSTHSWDEWYNGRRVCVGEDAYDYASFTDGHRDYARELSADFHFIDDYSKLAVSYIMQRYQYGQGEPTSVTASVWHSSFANSGHEGNSHHSVEMTVEQEEQMLRAFADIGGISLEGFDS